MSEIKTYPIKLQLRDPSERGLLPSEAVELIAERDKLRAEIERLCETYQHADYVFMVLRQYAGKDGGKLTPSEIVCRLIDDAESAESRVAELERGLRASERLTAAVEAERDLLKEKLREEMRHTANLTGQRNAAHVERSTLAAMRDWAWQNTKADCPAWIIARGFLDLIDEKYVDDDGNILVRAAITGSDGSDGGDDDTPD